MSKSSRSNRRNFFRNELLIIRYTKSEQIAYAKSKITCNSVLLALFNDVFTFFRTTSIIQNGLLIIPHMRQINKSRFEHSEILFSSIL